MAGNGPPPKEASQRRRRNAPAAGAKTLAVPTEPRAVPPLPILAGAMTTAWWTDVWRSPMAAEYDASDLHGLVMLAALVESFWDKPDTKTAAEIRLQGQRFGLSPIDRRRLQWEIERTDAALAAGDRRRAESSKRREDPRTKDV